MSRGRYLLEGGAGSGLITDVGKPLEVMPPRERTRDLVSRYVSRLGFIPPPPEVPDDPPGLPEADSMEGEFLRESSYQFEEALYVSLEDPPEALSEGTNGADSAVEEQQEVEQPPAALAAPEGSQGQTPA